MEEPTQKPKKDKVPRATKEEIEEEYLEEDSGGVSLLSKLKPILIPVLIAVAASWFLVNMLAVPKSLYNNALLDVNSRLSAAEVSLSDVATIKADQNSLSNTTTTSIQNLQNQVEGFSSNIANQSQVNSLLEEVDTLNARIETIDFIIADSTSIDEITILGNTITALKVTISEYESRIIGMEDLLEELALVDEEGETTTTTILDDPEEAVTVDLGYSQYIVWEAGDPLELSVSKPVYFEVNNELDQNIEDVELEIIINTRGVNLNLEQTLCSITGSYPLQFSTVYVSNGIVVLNGTTPPWGDGLEIDAKSNEDVYFTINLGVLEGAAPVNDIILYITAKCKSYNVVD